MTASIAVICHSGRSGILGFSEELDKGITSESVTVKRFSTAQLLENIDALDAFDGFIFESDDNTSNEQASLLQFMEASMGKSLRGSWRDKIATVVTSKSEDAASSDWLTTLIQYSMFSARQNMVWINTDSASPSLRSGDTAPGPEVSDNIPPAFLSGQRIAQLTKSWCCTQ